MTENKTKATDASVERYFSTIEDKGRREDCEALAKLMGKITGQPARMWGRSIVGFGSYHYKYESGRKGDMCVVGFSCRKGDISLYGLNAAPDHDELISKLGKHKAGKGCLYIKSLGGIDLQVLKTLVSNAVTANTRKHKVL